MSSSYKKRKGEVDEWYPKIKSIFEDVDDKYKKIQSVLAGTVSKSENLQELIDKIETQRNTIQNSINDLENKIQEGDQFFEVTYNNFVTKFEENQNSYQEILEQLQSHLQSSTTNSTEISKILENSNTDYDETVEKVEEIKSFYNETFLNLKGKIEDTETGLNAIYGQSRGLRNKINNTKKEVDELHQQSKSNTIEIDNFYKKSKSQSDKISTYKTDSEQAKNDIYEYLKLSQDGILSNDLGKRSDRISLSANIWLGIFIVLCLISLGGVVWYLNTVNGNDIGVMDLIRMLFGLPLAGFLFISYDNYRYERSMEEQYKFKSISSAILSSHIKTARDSFDNKNNQFEQRLADFSLEVMNKIFTEPKITKNNFLYKFKLGNKWANIETHIEEKVRETVSKAIENNVKKE